MTENTESVHSSSPEQTGHTPGPWSVIRAEKSNLVMVVGPVKENGNRDKVALFPAMMPGQIAESNARLIAAAPELLKELKRIVRFFGDFEESGLMPAGFSTFNGARAAIAKAEGEPSPESTASSTPLARRKPKNNSGNHDA